MSDKSNLTFCFPPSLPPCMAEFANVFCVCFGRRSFELVRTVFYLRGMSAIVRTGPRRSSNRPRSSAKIRLSRVQKQIYLHFAEANKAKIQDKPKAKTNSFALCRGERSADMDSKQSRIPVCGGKNRHDNESARQLLPKERTQDYLCPRSAKRLRQALFFLPLSGNFRIGANRAR